jgi:hypothetical protein
MKPIRKKGESSDDNDDLEFRSAMFEATVRRLTGLYEEPKRAEAQRQGALP